jgi:hypothetical protein
VEIDATLAREAGGKLMLKVDQLNGVVRMWQQA